MKESIFRQKNIDKINSPESLNDYVKVTNPSVWIILVGVVIFIIGAIAFGTMGTVDTNVTAAAEAVDGTVTVYIDEADLEQIEPGMKVTIQDTECVITEIANRPIKSTDIDEYVLHKVNMELSQWVYPVSVDCKMEDGVYAARITIESVSPMSYLFN